MTNPTLLFDLPEEFSQFPGDSKVWVYQSSRKLTPKEFVETQDKIETFVAKEWSAHGTKLTAKGVMLTPYHIGLAVLGDVTASGCSIDASVKFIKSIGNQLDIDFFSRLNILIEESETERFVPFSKLNTVPNAIMYNPMISNIEELQNNWKIPVDSL